MTCLLGTYMSSLKVFNQSMRIVRHPSTSSCVCATSVGTCPTRPSTLSSPRIRSLSGTHTRLIMLCSSCKAHGATTALARPTNCSMFPDQNFNQEATRCSLTSMRATQTRLRTTLLALLAILTSRAPCRILLGKVSTQ